jgi:hypothetical protein
LTTTTTDPDTLAVNTKFGFTPGQVAQVARERVAAARDGRA